MYAIIKSISDDSSSQGIYETSIFALIKPDGGDISYFNTLPGPNSDTNIIYDYVNIYDDYAPHIDTSMRWTICKKDVEVFETASELKEYLLEFVNKHASASMQELAEIFFGNSYHMFTLSYLGAIKTNISLIFQHVLLEPVPESVANFFKESIDKAVISTKTLINKFEEIFKEYYKENFYKKNDQYYIHYPYVKISNSSGREHDIYDLFVRIGIREYDGYISLYFQGSRITLSDLEIRATYMHSHLPGSSSYGQFNDFCLGEGHLNSYRNVSSEEMLMTLPSSLDRYVEWESLEGGPYRKIIDVKNQAGRITARNQSIPEILIETSLKKAILSEKVELNISENNISFDVKSSYIPDLHMIKLNDVYIRPENCPEPEKSNEQDFIINIVNTEGLILIRMSDGTRCKFPYKNLQKKSSSNEKAEVANYVTDVLRTNFDRLIKTRSIIHEIITKTKNELIELN